MTYEQICKYVFSERRVDWELHDYRCRSRVLVQARQISIYLGNWFYPMMTDKALTEIFAMDHASAHHALKTIKNLMYSDKQMTVDVSKYLKILDERIRMEEIVKGGELLKDDAFNLKIHETLDSMEVITRAYCSIKGITLPNN